MNLKRKIFGFNTSILFLCLTSCHRISGNYIDYYHVSDAKTENGIIEMYYANNYNFVNINKEEKTILVIHCEDDGTDFNNVIEGDTGPRSLIYIKDGYENIQDNVENINDLGTTSSVYSTVGILMNDYVYGICNVYYDTVGYLSGGGNLADEEIAYSVLYKYDLSNDKLENIYKAKKTKMVAFNEKYVVFYKDNKFYSRNLETNEEKAICGSFEYHPKFSSGWYIDVSFNSEYVLIYTSEETENGNHFFLYEFGGDTIELSEVKS